MVGASIESRKGKGRSFEGGKMCGLKEEGGISCGSAEGVGGSGAEVVVLLFCRSRRREPQKT